MGIRGDLIAVAVAGVVLVAAGMYAKKKISDALPDMPKDAGDAMSKFDRAIDRQINSVGAYITGNPSWTYYSKPQDKYDMGGNDFGVLDDTWDDPVSVLTNKHDMGGKDFGITGGW